MELRTVRRLGYALILILSMACGAASDRAPSPDEQETKVTRAPLEDVLREHSPTLIEIEGVVAIYEGRDEHGEACVRIDVDTLTDSLRQRLPDALGGWPVVVEETGEIRPLDEDS